MTNKDNIDIVFNHLMKNPSQKLLKLFNDSNTGMGAVFRILKSTSSPITASKISELMNVSEARVTALLNKMQKRGYISKEKSVTDARMTYVKLTELGNCEAEKLHNILCKNIAVIIDTVGFEKIGQYICLTEEINTAIQNNLSTPPDIT